MKNIILFLLFVSLKSVLFAQTWTPAGPDDKNQPILQSPFPVTSLASDKAGGFYIPYTHYIWASTKFEYKAAVRRWNGTHWQQIGQTGFSIGSAEDLKVVVDPAATPIVMYRDLGIGGKIVVKSFDGTSWNNVGNPVSAGPVAFPDIALDGAGTPYVAYADSLSGYKPTVKKWNGTAWQVLGDSAFTTTEILTLKLAVNRSGTPKVFVQYYADNPMGSEIFSLSGAGWTSLGNPANNKKLALMWIDIACSDDDTTYAAFEDYYKNYLNIYKYTGAAWVNVGDPISTGADIANIQLLIDSLKGLYVLGFSSPYKGSTWTDHIMVRHFNGSMWEMVGPDSLINDESRTAVLGLDTAHVPYILYASSNYYGCTLLRKLNGNSWDIMGTSKGFSDGPSSIISVASSPDGKKAYSIASNYAGIGFNGPSHVYRFDDTVWTNIGQPGSSSASGAISSIAVGPDGNPWVAVNDSITHECNIWRYMDTGWVNNGSIGAATAPSLTFTRMGTPYIAYHHGYDAQVTVSKYTGSAWVALNGSPVPNNAYIDFFRFNTDNNGVPYILYGSHGSQAVGSQYAFDVAKYDTTLRSWVSVTGWFNSGMGTSPGSTPDIAFDTANALYITYLNNSEDNIKVKRFNGRRLSFSDIVTPAADTLRGAYPRIQFAEDGSLFLSYFNLSVPVGYGGTSVVRLSGTHWQSVGNSPLSEVASADQELALLNNRMVITFRYAAAFAYKYDCAQPVAISYQPKDTVVCSGSNAGFNTIARGATSYLWQIDTGRGWHKVPDNGLYSGQTDATLLLTAVPSTLNNAKFRCIFTNACGGTMISEPAVLHVEPSGMKTPGISITSDKPVACAGMPVSFMAHTTNSGYLHTFEWHINGTAVKRSADSFFTTTTLAPGDLVTCRLIRFSACGSADSANSNIASVEIAPDVPPSLSITASPGTSISQGQSVTFTATAINGGASPHYQWLLNNNIIPGATGQNYTSGSLTNGDVISAEITRDDTCAVTNTARSQQLTIRVSTGLKEKEQRYGFKIFPQPAKDYVMLSGNSDMPAGNYKITLRTSTGQALAEFLIKIDNTPWTYKLRLPKTIPDGLYYITLFNADLQLVSKLSVIH